jgi:AraC-like DNA-binding protein
LFDRIANAGSAKEGMELLAESVGATETRTRFQRAIGYMERRRGFVSLDDMARDAGLSSRQFRRVCLRDTGLSPKLLARILRFRHAEARATGEGGAHAELAADCGFTDQAHMISEFRRFSGRTPNGLC